MQGVMLHGELLSLHPLSIIELVQRRLRRRDGPFEPSVPDPDLTHLK